MIINWEKRVLYFVLIFVTLFGVLISHPANISQPDYWKARFGKYDRHLIRPFQMAERISYKPFNQSWEHFLYGGRNPGIFKFVSEVFIRLGFQSPLPVSLFMLFLMIMGIIAMYLWVREYFENPIITICCLLFLICGTFLTYYSVNTHQHSINFLFFNLTILNVVRHIKTSSKKYFILALISYFIITLNYYMFIMSTSIFIYGLYYFKKRKFLPKEIVMFGLVLIFSLSLLFFQVVKHNGGVEKAIENMKSRLVYRLANKGIHQKKSSHIDFKYPSYVSEKIDRFFILPISLFIIVSLITRKLAIKNNSSFNYKVFYFITPAALSWYMIMLQHSRTHTQSGRYSWFLWMLLLSCLCMEMLDYYKKNNIKKWKIYLGWMPLFLIYGVGGFGYFNFYKSLEHIKNIFIFQNQIEKAENRDEYEILNLRSNFVMEIYRKYNSKWDSNLDISNYVEINGIKYKRFGDEVFIINQDTGKRLKFVLINNKEISIDYPNRTLGLVTKRNFEVIKINFKEDIKELKL